MAAPADTSELNVVVLDVVEELQEITQYLVSVIKANSYDDGMGATDITNLLSLDDKLVEFNTELNRLKAEFV